MTSTTTARTATGWISRSPGRIRGVVGGWTTLRSWLVRPSGRSDASLRAGVPRPCWAGRGFEREREVLRRPRMAGRFLGRVRPGEREVRGLVADDHAELIQLGPIGEDPDHLG